MIDGSMTRAAQKRQDARLLLYGKSIVKRFHQAHSLNTPDEMR